VIPLQEAQCAVAVAQHGSFRKAATNLYLSQPAVSSYIDRIERRIGVTLFDRARTGAVLTHDGREVLPHLEALIATHAEVERACRHIANERHPTLTVASERIGLVSLLPPALRVMRGIVDQLAVSLRHATEEQMINLVATGEVDLAMSYRLAGTDCPNAALEEVAILTTPTVVFVAPGHRLAGVPYVRNGDLAGETVIAVRSPFATAAVREFLRDVDDVSWVFVDDAQILLSMVDAGVGVAVSIAAAAVLGPPSLIRVPIFEPAMIELTLMRRRQQERSSSPAEILWDLLTTRDHSSVA